jgi:hypothetical protein
MASRDRDPFEHFGGTDKNGRIFNRPTRNQAEKLGRNETISRFHRRVQVCRGAFSLSLRLKSFHHCRVNRGHASQGNDGTVQPTHGPHSR